MYSGVDYAMTGWLNATVDAPDGYFGPRRGNFLDKMAMDLLFF